MSGQPVKPAETLAERFWSVAREMESEETAGDPDPVGVVILVMLRQYQIMGDMTYASPEQARGEEMDERSSVFSVGVLLFEKLTGRHPFGAEAAGRRLARMQKGELGSGVSFFPKLPEKLRHVLMRAMGPFPEDRWESLKDLRQALEKFVIDSGRGRSLPGVARPPDAPLENAPTRVVNMTAIEQMARLSAERGGDTPVPEL